MGSNSPRERFYVFTYPRTGSNLLTHLLALDDQPNVASNAEGTRFFLPLQLLRLKHQCLGALAPALPYHQRAEQEKCLTDCFNRLLQHLDTAERDGKIVCFKDHAHYIIEPTAEARLLSGEQSAVDDAPWTLIGPNKLEQTRIGRSDLNETLFSDDFLKTWKPVFLIKHPAAAFPSFYRALVNAAGREFVESDRGWRFYQKAMSLRWVYKLYHFYLEHFRSPGQYSTDDQLPWPIIVEADDIITQPAILVKICQIIGLESSRLRFTWDKMCSDESPGVQAFRKTLFESTAIDPSRAVGDVDLEKESIKWREEFGDEIGCRIETHVREAMPDYVFLKSMRLQV
ncbi:hypothetical protein BDV26DRAFT_301987 [Aspergillus bertholletiae]|uniref:P-loop containing nucleoside triphosphate hydrolase protein n=1 Tax=Aspergillus bertholletiae TaxID=1226010 RepID=A0A5N7BHH6_9EURO|nr:hypothetical protein BDV26DRAFT_301987 [Aspergillus bertholletiae]